MPICVSEYEALDAAGSIGQRLGEHPRRGRLEYGVAMLQPASVEEREPWRAEHLGAAIEERLSQRMHRARGGLATMHEVRLQFADCVAVQRHLELLVNDHLVSVIRAVQWPRKDEPQRPRPSRT